MPELHKIIDTQHSDAESEEARKGGKHTVRISITLSDVYSYDLSLPKLQGYKRHAI